MCELGLAEDFYRRGKDVPYILIKVDPKPEKQEDIIQSQKGRKKGKNYDLILPYFPGEFL